jgi:hypothetical protein
MAVGVCLCSGRRFLLPPIQERVVIDNTNERRVQTAFAGVGFAPIGAYSMSAKKWLRHAPDVAPALQDAGSTFLAVNPDTATGDIYVAAARIVLKGGAAASEARIVSVPNAVAAAPGVDLVAYAAEHGLFVPVPALGFATAFYGLNPSETVIIAVDVGGLRENNDTNHCVEINWALGE